jgi:hypothetical protein
MQWRAAALDALGDGHAAGELRARLAAAGFQRRAGSGIPVQKEGMR